MVVGSTVLLTLAASFCLFDAEEHGATGHAMALDLCLGLLVPSLAVVLLVRLPLNGWATAFRTVRAPMTPLYIPAPPPKSVSF